MNKSMTENREYSLEEIEQMQQDMLKEEEAKLSSSINELIQEYKT